MQAIAVAPEVIEGLAQMVSTELLEKQALVDEVSHLQKRLKWLQSETQKKSVIISELKTMMIPVASDNRRIQITMKDFQQLLDDTQVQNECHLENLQIAGFEIEGLEQERTSLLGILREFDR